MTHTSKPFHTGIRAFDQNYGSHARGGDAWLFFGPSGAGKTMLACQAAGYTASAGKLVAYVTAQSKESIFICLRAYSAVSSVPYEQVKAVMGSGGNHPLAPALAEWHQNHGKNLDIIEWDKTAGLGFKEQYKRILDSFRTKHGKVPDLTVLDQLCGVLRARFDDHIQKKDTCNEVATIVANTAAELDNVAILVAQANNRCAGKADLTENDTADSRSLCESMTGVLGITRLPESDTAQAEVYSKNQYLVVCKCREEALRIMVKREFDRARFVGRFDWEAQQEGEMAVAPAGPRI